MSNLNPEKALVFRITHVDNVPWVLESGLHSRNSKTFDPGYRSIGNPDLIDKRQHREVPVPPGGVLADYVPFYFTPFSIMLYNIKTGYGGIQRLPNHDIVILVSSLRKVAEMNIPFVFTNGHAYPETADYFNALDDLNHIDWRLLRSRDFRNDPEDPGKKERYQAEALIHLHLPVEGLIGMMCAEKTVRDDLQSQAEKHKLGLQIHCNANWYF